MVSKSLLERTRALASTQRRKQQEEIDDDVTPQDLLAAFDSCRKRDDGTVDARALAHWLQVDAGARNFAAHVQALKKPRFTRTEFEKLVNAYEIRVANAVAQGKGDDAAARARIKKKPGAKRGAPTGSGDNKDSDGEKGEGDDDDKDGSKTTANLSSTAGRMRMKARVEAKKQERLQRMQSGDEDDDEEEEDAEPKTPTSRNGGREMFEEVSLSDNEDNDVGGKSAKDASLSSKHKGAPKSAPASSSMFKLTQGLKLFKFSSSSSGDLKKRAPVDPAAALQPDTALRSPSPRGLSATAPASTQAVATAAVKQTAKKGISLKGLKRSMSWTSSQKDGGGGGGADAATAAAGAATAIGTGREVGGNGMAVEGKRAGGKRPSLHFTTTTDPPSPATHTHTDSPSEPSTPTPLASTRAFSDFDAQGGRAQQAAKPSPTKRFWSLTLSPAKSKKGGKETNKENTKAAANRVDMSQQPPPLTLQQMQQIQQQQQMQQMQMQQQVQTQAVAQQQMPVQLEKMDRSQRALQKVITSFGKPKSAPPSLATTTTNTNTATATTPAHMPALALSLTQNGGSALGDTANMNFDSDDEDDDEEGEEEEGEGCTGGPPLAATRPATLDTSAAVAHAPRMYDMRSPMDPALSMAVANLSQTSHGVERPHLEDLLRDAQKRSVSKFANERKNKVLLEGKVEHWARHMGVMTWVNLHMVLYAGTKELRIYTDSVQSAWGVVPIHEKGAIELRLLEKMECPTDAKWQGRRFDLICRSYNGEAKYPALGIKPGDENRVPHTIRYKFRAPTAQSRLLWVTLITAVLESPQMRMVKSPLANTYINMPGCSATAAGVMMSGTGMHTGVMSRSGTGVLRLGGGGGSDHDDDGSGGSANDASFFGTTTTTTTDRAGGMMLTDTLTSTTTSAYLHNTQSGSQYSQSYNTDVNPFSPSATATNPMLNPGMSATSSAALMGATHANGHTGLATGGNSVGVGGGGGGGGAMARPPRKPGKLGLKDQALLMLGEGKARA